MKCPLFTVGGYENSHLPEFGFNDCLEKECAWWDGDLELCAVRQLGIAGQLLVQELAILRDTLPHKVTL